MNVQQTGKEKLQVNKVHNAEVINSDLFEKVEAGRLFDVILTNPPIRAGKDTVHQIFDQSYDRLKPDGVLWVVIQKKQGGPSAISKLETLFTEVSKVKQDKGYWIIKATKK